MVRYTYKRMIAYFRNSFWQKMSILRLNYDKKHFEIWHHNVDIWHRISDIWLPKRVRSPCLVNSWTKNQICRFDMLTFDIWHHAMSRFEILANYTHLNSFWYQMSSKFHIWHRSSAQLAQLSSPNWASLAIYIFFNYNVRKLIIII